MSGTQQLLLTEGGGAAPNYIEDVFSTYLYTGTGATLNTINNAIDLSTKGGLVWIKYRNSSLYGSRLYDTIRGVNKFLATNSTGAQDTSLDSLTAFNTNGFALGGSGTYEPVNESGGLFASWTFRKQPKFFDVVTYTGNGTTQNIAHNLGSVPGCIIVKRLSNASNKGWPVYHRYDYTQHGFLNTTDSFNGAQEETWFGNNSVSVAPTSAVFTVGSNQDINASANTYVAYIFAHDAGGFGLTGTDNVISCGSFTTNGSGNSTVTLGYEPQYILYKQTNTSGDDWKVLDTMRGWNYAGFNSSKLLFPNLSDAESNGNKGYPTSTGFYITESASSTYIYIAIRRGPMKVPTDGTKVFSPVSRAGTGAAATITAGFPVDLIFAHGRNLGGSDPVWEDRLRGYASQLLSNGTSAESTRTDVVTSFASNTGITVGADGYNYINTSGYNWINYLMQRAPSFFDEVCYTGTNTAQTLTHNLGVVPEFIICKDRTAPDAWYCYSAAIGNTKYIRLDNNAAASAAGSQWWNNTSPTSTTFTAGTAVSTSPDKYVAYLFATCTGVSKVGSYTGTGTLTTINCGFTGGARFVLIKRTDSTSNWFVWDTARGMVAGTDPMVALNSGAAESNANSVYTITTGFQLLASPAVDVNTNGGTYIYLAIA